MLCKVQLVRDYGRSGLRRDDRLPSFYHNLFKWGHQEATRVRMDAHYALVGDEDDASPPELLPATGY